ncbi:arrestin domain-containing protein 2-like isoform X2 [Augochlora pura]
MSSVRAFHIIFERPGASYMAGEIVRGTIILDTTKTKNIRGIHYTAKGAALVLWRETRTRRGERIHETYRSSQHYFSQRVEILVPSEPNSRIDLPEGHHQYPFQFQLPTDIPSSFEHTYGHVRYTVKVTVDRPWKFDHECKVAFTVVSILDLNIHRDKCLGLHEEVRKSFSCCCFDQGSVNVTIQVPSTGYVPGQTINTLVNYANASSDVGITKISLKLERVLKLHANTRTRTEEFEVAASSYAGPFTTQGTIILEIKVPPIPPSYMPFCKILDLDYYLKVGVHFTGSHLKITRRYPVLIGSVPLYYAPSAPDIQPINITPYPTKEPATSNATPMPEVPQPGTSTDNTQPPYIGFVVPDQSNPAVTWNIPPPSYEECMIGAQNIRDDDESIHVDGANTPFRPKYPVFNYPSPSATNS